MAPNDVLTAPEYPTRAAGECAEVAEAEFASCTPKSYLEPAVTRDAFFVTI